MRIKNKKKGACCMWKHVAMKRLGRSKISFVLLQNTEHIMLYVKKKIPEQSNQDLQKNRAQQLAGILTNVLESTNR